MDFAVNSKTIASFQLQAVQLVPLLGSFELAFLFSGSVHGENEEVYRRLEVSGARIWLCATGGHLTDLGLATADSAVVVRQLENPSREQFALKLVLLPYQIDLLEQLRNGEDLNFKLRFFARGSTSTSGGQDWQEQGDMSCDVHVRQRDI